MQRRLRRKREPGASVPFGALYSLRRDICRAIDQGAGSVAVAPSGTVMLSFTDLVASTERRVKLGEDGDYLLGFIERFL